MLLFPDFCGTEDRVSEQRIRMFESLVGKNIAWAYFSNNWSKQIQFSASAVLTSVQVGRIPFIRMMPRSDFEENRADPIYTLQAIIDGKFDAQLFQWKLEV